MLQVTVFPQAEGDLSKAEREAGDGGGGGKGSRVP